MRRQAAVYATHGAHFTASEVLVIQVNYWEEFPLCERYHHFNVIFDLCLWIFYRGLRRKAEYLVIFILA